MQKIWTLIIVILIAFSCSPSKKATDITVGNWDYIVKGTPNGDVTGYFMITRDGDGYAGSINSNQGGSPFNTLNIDSDNQLEASFDYGGYRMNMKGTFVGQAFSGNISVDGNNFPITATKQE